MCELTSVRMVSDRTGVRGQVSSKMGKLDMLGIPWTTIAVGIDMSDMTLTDLEAIAGKHRTRQASEVKSNWRAIVKEAKEGEVIVTSYNRPEAVVMSAARYAELREAARANDPLRHLRDEFERQLAVLRAPGAEDKMRAFLNASPQEIADAANDE